MAGGREVSIPKTLPCKVCGKKPRREWIGWSYGDSNDEFTLICKHGKGDYIRVPEPLKQCLSEEAVVRMWNEKQGAE